MQLKSIRSSVDERCDRLRSRNWIATGCYRNPASSHFNWLQCLRNNMQSYAYPRVKPGELVSGNDL